MIEPIINKTYRIRPNITAVFLEKKIYNPTFSGGRSICKSHTRYIFRNLKTNRVITLKSRTKILFEEN